MTTRFERLPPHLKAAIELGMHGDYIPQGRENQHAEVSFEGTGFNLPENVGIIHGLRHPDGFHATVYYRTADKTHEVHVRPDGNIRMPKQGSAELNVGVLETALRVHKALAKYKPKK